MTILIEHESQDSAHAGGTVAADGPDTLEQCTQAMRRARRDLVDLPAARSKQHQRGKLHARDRINVLLDPGSFVEIDGFRRHVAFGAGLDGRRPAGDGVVTGWGTVQGRQVFVFAHDFTVMGGSLGATFARKICKVMDLALAARAPIVGISDGAGARIQEGVDALAGYGEIFKRNVAASGVIPQISVLAGPCAGGAAYSPALTDFVFMVEEVATMFVTGPDVVKAVTGEVIDAEGLGGAEVHQTCSGVAHFVDDDEVTCLERVRALLSYLPSSSAGEPRWELTGDDADRRCDDLLRIVPANARAGYDVRDVIGEVLDRWTWMEVSERWAENVVCGFGRLDGRAVGVVANQPAVRAGVLDIDASEKAASFVRTCDAFNIPLVTLVDVPGFLPGSDQEHGGIVRRGAKLLYAYCEATVPRVQVILRKAYGGAYIVMDSRSVGCDVSLAWPANEIAVMGAEGAVDVLHRRELAAADDADGRRRELVDHYRETMMHPWTAAERGHVDDLIDPTETRRALIRALRMLADKRVPRPDRKHGNIPL
jgi:acetyl-CoA carboxylase carboxyltransferase component